MLYSLTDFFFCVFPSKLSTQVRYTFNKRGSLISTLSISFFFLFYHLFFVAVLRNILLLQNAQVWVIVCSNNFSDFICEYGKGYKLTLNGVPYTGAQYIFPFFLSVRLFNSYHQLLLLLSTIRSLSFICIQFFIKFNSFGKH